MTHLKELRKQAREKGLKGYSTLCRGDLESLLANGALQRRETVTVKKRSSFSVCEDCLLRRVVTCLIFISDGEEPAPKRFRVEIVKKLVYERLHEDAKQRVYDGDLEFDAETGELVDCAVDYSREWR